MAQRQHHTHDDDYAFEPLPGLPAPLPEGERMLWRGAPNPWKFAARAMRLAWVGAYFVALAGWQLASLVNEGASLAQMANSLSWTATLAFATLLILGGLGFAIAKNAVYTITSRRIILRHGVAMPMAINVPFAVIDGADHRAFADGSGDVSVRLTAGQGIARLILWPHARPGYYAKTQPMLRAVPDSAKVARILGEALAAHAGQAAAVQAATVQAATVQAEREVGASAAVVRDRGAATGSQSIAGAAFT